MIGMLSVRVESGLKMRPEKSVEKLSFRSSESFSPFKTEDTQFESTAGDV